MTDDDTNNRLWWIRVRKRLADLAPAIILGLLVVGALGGWVVYQTHANPGVETDQRTVASWSERGTDSYAAEVTEPNPLFREGQTLSGRPVYFTRISPELRGAYTYSYTASDTGSLDVTLNASLRLRSVGDDETLWSVTEPLHGTHVEDVSPDEQTTVETVLNISQVAAEVNRIQERLGASVGTTEIDLVFDVQVVGSVNGENVAKTHTRSLRINPEGSTYSVDPPEELDVSHDSTAVVESEQSYGPFRSYGPVVFVVLSALGLFGFVIASYKGWVRPSRFEQTRLEQSQQREKFDDWISTGVVPDRERTGTGIELDSLEDLVDVAIDTNERVIEDTGSGDFYVPGGDRYFVYSPDPVRGIRSRDPTEEDTTGPDSPDTNEEETTDGVGAGRDRRSGGSPSTDGGASTDQTQGSDSGEHGDDDTEAEGTDS
jgi:hypothetical protein